MWLTFIEQDIDGDMLLELDQEILEELDSLILIQEHMHVGQFLAWGDWTGLDHHVTAFIDQDMGINWIESPS